jgi:uncharacterized integral membrane protein
MNIKLIFKCLVIIAVLVLLVVMGLNNQKPVALTMPRFGTTQPAALMYIGFFGFGFLVGAILMSGGGKKSGGGSGSGSGASKPSKAKG